MTLGFLDGARLMLTGRGGLVAVRDGFGSDSESSVLCSYLQIAIDQLEESEDSMLRWLYAVNHKVYWSRSLEVNRNMQAQDEEEIVECIFVLQAQDEEEIEELEKAIGSCRTELKRFRGAFVAVNRVRGVPEEHLLAMRIEITKTRSQAAESGEETPSK